VPSVSRVARAFFEGGVAEVVGTLGRVLDPGRGGMTPREAPVR
jgi:hypothetical protein